jgi:hypothetical protein
MSRQSYIAHFQLVCKISVVNPNPDPDPDPHPDSDSDPHGSASFLNLDPDPHPHQGNKPDLDPHQIKRRIWIRAWIRIKEKCRSGSA